MNTQQGNQLPFNEGLFELLLLQFAGDGGELPIAIAYLSQAANEDDALLKSTLVRIAREKIKHANILGSMLLQMAQGRSGPLSTTLDQSELQEVLATKGVRNDNHERASILLERFSGIKNLQASAPHFASDPKAFLEANIITEEAQIAAYEKIALLTTDRNFVSALNYAKAR